MHNGKLLKNFEQKEGQISFINLKDISDCCVENIDCQGAEMEAREAARRILIW